MNKVEMEEEQRGGGREGEDGMNELMGVRGR